MNKYRNTKVTVDGMVFDSKKEANYYLFLKEKQRNGEIDNLRMQVPYELIPPVYEEEVKHLKTKDKVVTKCVQRATHYVADFVYTVTSTGIEEVVDVKSFITRKNPEYRLKKKMMRAFKGITIMEV
jgi:hypothetical protein